MLLWLLVKGVLVGIIIAVPAGPVGVLCIRRTIFHGQMAGFLSGLGAATADAVFGIIAAFGLTVISDLLLDYRDWLRVGGAAHPFYRWVAAQVGEGGTPRWNFHKYLIGPDGQLAGAWPSQVKPTDPAITKEIDGMLTS